MFGGRDCNSPEGIVKGIFSPPLPRVFNFALEPKVQNVFSNFS
jgi:hypothetical protein